MVRKFLILGAFTAAGLALTACDNPASGLLSTAKTGDCFSVTGKDAYGQPKLIHADCPAGQTSGQSTLPPASTDQATAAAPGATSPSDADKSAPPSLPATTASTSATASTVGASGDDKAVCQPAAPTCVAPATRSGYVMHTARYARPVHYGRAHRVRRTHWVTHRRHGKMVTEVVTEYVTVDGQEYTTAGLRPAPYPPGPPAPPTTQTYVLGDHPVYRPAPPPPPPVRYENRGYDSRAYDSRGYSSNYDSRSYSSSSTQHYGPPPPQQRPPCNCDRRPQPQYAPDGYLTWPGKSGY